MRHPMTLVALSLALLTFAGDAAFAQTALTRADRRVMREQDEQQCLRQAAHHDIPRRNRAEFVRKCMADRQGERKVQAKKEAADQRRMKREMAAEEWAEIQKVRNQERRQQLEQQAAKRAECNKQASERKLRLKERRNFVKKCVGA
jgi:formylmethanofuran dehydrogenase subunit E